MRTLTIEIDDQAYTQLQRIVGEDLAYVASTVEHLAGYLLQRAADGVRREGSWERAWIQQATGAKL